MRKKTGALVGVAVAGSFILILAACVISDISEDTVYYRAQSRQVSDRVSEEVSLPTQTVNSPQIVFVGPRGNVPDDTPIAYGFWSFAIPVPSVLSRSGQPLISEFQWLADHGWGAVVNFRVDGERGEIGDDAKLPGFNDLGLKYLHLPITDGYPPTGEQAEQFLAFVTNPANQPVHIHCRGGIGRAGTMTALYRYAVQGWPMDQAIEESRSFKGGVSFSQKKWLEGWAAEHPPGSHSTAFEVEPQKTQKINVQY